MNVITDFLLSFLKLSTNKILIGILMISLGFSLYKLNEKDNKHSKELLEIKKEYKSETDTLRSIILKQAVEHEKEKIIMIKDCYEDKEKVRDLLITSEINANKKK